MAKSVSRRDGLKLALTGLASAAVANGTGARAHDATTKLSRTATHDWSNRNDRVWLGGDVWANPMENWSIRDGMAECLTSAANRTIHSLPHQIVDPSAAFSISVDVTRRAGGKSDGGAAIRIGARSEIDDHRANCFVLEGLDAGLCDGELRLGDARLALPSQASPQSFTLELHGKPKASAVALTLILKSADGTELGRLDELAAADSVRGNIGLVSNFAASSEDTADTRFAFANWRIAGEAFCDEPRHRFGPILWAMYTLDDTGGDEGHVMTMSALIGPMGRWDTQRVELQIQRDGEWVTLQTTTLDVDVWTAIFRVPKWPSESNVPYRLLYREALRDGGEEIDTFDGVVRADPTGHPLRMAALTCQNDYAFPYQPVADNVVKLDPDIVFFSGDQIYENHGGYGLVRSPDPMALVSYLRKYYQFGWAFRETMRNNASVVLPDDHDVFMGNIWGEGGARMDDEARLSGRTDNAGGYMETPRFVNAVHRTTVGNLPRPVDPEPIAQGISVYHTTLTYGEVGFAIIADRMWKSGPERLGIIVGETGQDEAPDTLNPDVDDASLDLLGSRQERFLDDWSRDWRGHKLKAVLSQSVLAGVATHQPTPENYIKYDFDGNGWPSAARNRAVSLIAQGEALHICGDTHLGTLTQYGVERQRDASWAFCTPAIAAGWQRWWQPETLGLPVGEKPAHGLPNTGEYSDSFGNLVYVYAVGNPDLGTSPNRYLRAHQKGSGFGFVTFDKDAQTYRMDAYRFFADVTGDGSQDQFPGWPVTVHRAENGGAQT